MHRLASLFLLTAFVMVFAACSTVDKGGPMNTVADEERAGDIALGEEYSAWESSSGRSHPWGIIALLYIPNRILDALDIVRADVGLGPAFGGVIRLTRFAQAGYRTFSPFSMRLGLRGRALPVFMEQSSEFGISPAYSESQDREVTPAEIGVGVDVLLAGAYGGVSLDELGDFILGIFTIDLSGDDL